MIKSSHFLYEWEKLMHFFMGPFFSSPQNSVIKGFSRLLKCGMVFAILCFGSLIFCPNFWS